MTAAVRRSAASIGGGERVAIYVLLLFASFAYNYNFVLIDYIRPFLTRGGGMTLAETAWLYTGQGTGVLIGSVIAPVLVSRFGTRHVLAASLVALAVLTTGNELVVSFPAWLVSRFLVGFALTGTYTASITMLANLFPPHLRGRLLSVNMAMFSVALLSIGGLGALFGEAGWRSLVRIGAAAPAVAALLCLALLPDDRRIAVYGDCDRADEANDVRGSWAEMLSGRRRRLTLACLLLAGLNFSAYQFYSGLITTYLIEVRHFGAALTGLFVTIDGVGTLIGSLFWGFMADRFGRRVNAAGFALAALFTLLFLVAPVSTPVLLLLELGYAVSLSCTNIWPPISPSSSRFACARWGRRCSTGGMWCRCWRRSSSPTLPRMRGLRSAWRWPRPRS